MQKAKGTKPRTLCSPNELEVLYSPKLSGDLAKYMRIEDAKNETVGRRR